MTSGYPMLLDLRERRVVVCGGGNVAARKVRGLLDAGARVTVISPTLHADLEALGDRIMLVRDVYSPGLLAQIRPLLVFAATDLPEVNRQIADEARALDIPRQRRRRRQRGRFCDDGGRPARRDHAGGSDRRRVPGAGGAPAR
ncbi:MAG: NAD(P)-dependent oxidoreductase [Anaerolineae bacterium]